MTILADINIGFNHDVGPDKGSGSDRHIMPDNGIWPDFHVSIQFGL
jgi:hypothetical protein